MMRKLCFCSKSEHGRVHARVLQRPTAETIDIHEGED